MPLLNAGDLRDAVTVQQKTTVVDGQGGRTTTWGALLTNVRAGVTPLSATERWQVSMMGSTVTYTVSMRYRATVTPTMRVLWTPFGGTQKTLEIHGIKLDDGGRTMMTLECSEVV